MLRSHDITKLQTQVKLNIYCNNELKLNGADNGIARQMCVINYISQFKQVEDRVNNIYLIDVKLTDKVKDWAQDYMKLLLNTYSNDYKHNPPKVIVDASKTYIDENNDVLNFINEYYEKTDKSSDFVTLSKIKEHYQNNKQYEQSKLKTLKESLEKIFNTNFIENRKIGKMKYRSVILGWKRKGEDDEDDGNDDKYGLDVIYN